MVGWIHDFKAVQIENNAFIELGSQVVNASFGNRGVARTLINHLKKWCVKE
jgi:hypothetical protein